MQHWRLQAQVSHLPAACSTAPQASEALRGCALGIYDAQECRFQMSDVQLRLMDLLGAARSQGLLSSEVSASLNIAARNFYYVLKASGTNYCGRSYAWRRVRTLLLTICCRRSSLGFLRGSPLIPNDLFFVLHVAQRG